MSSTSSSSSCCLTLFGCVAHGVRRGWLDINVLEVLSAALLCICLEFVSELYNMIWIQFFDLEPDGRRLLRAALCNNRVQPLLKSCALVLSGNPVIPSTCAEMGRKLIVLLSPLSSHSIANQGESKDVIWSGERPSHGSPEPTQCTSIHFIWVDLPLRCAKSSCCILADSASTVRSSSAAVSCCICSIRRQQQYSSWEHASSQFSVAGMVSRLCFP